MTTLSKPKTYSELLTLNRFEDRLKYLSLNGAVGDITFGGHRYLNQMLYQTDRWKSTRRKVIFRDNGCDLAHDDYLIPGSIYVHHLNPITIDDILNEKPCVFDLENLVCTSFKTHNAIHYGIDNEMPRGLIIREKYDTCLWRL